MPFRDGHNLVPDHRTGHPDPRRAPTRRPARRSPAWRTTTSGTSPPWPTRPSARSSTTTSSAAGGRVTARRPGRHLDTPALRRRVHRARRAPRPRRPPRPRAVLGRDARRRDRGPAARAPPAPSRSATPPASMQLWSTARPSSARSCRRTCRTRSPRHEAAGTVDDPEYLAPRRSSTSATSAASSQPSGLRRLRDPDGAGADGLPHHERAERVPRHRHDARLEHRRPPRDAVAVPTLVVAGEHDEATPATWQPFVDRIRRRPPARLPRGEPLLAPGAARGVPPRDRGVPRRARRPRTGRPSAG